MSASADLIGSNVPWLFPYLSFFTYIHIREKLPSFSTWWHKFSGQVVLKIDNSQGPMSLYRKTKQSQWGISLFWFSSWGFMYSAASQADFYCSGTWIVLNSSSTSLPILYTQLHATQVKGKSPTAVLESWTNSPPRRCLGLAPGVRIPYVWLLVLMFISTLLF